jgi:hypothetical protein
VTSPRTTMALGPAAGISGVSQPLVTPAAPISITANRHCDRRMMPPLLRKRHRLLKDKDISGMRGYPGANPKVGKSERSSSCPMAAPARL